MSTEVRRIGLAERKVNESAVSMLEQTLARAKSGELTSVAIIEIRLGKTIATGWSEGADYHLLNSGAARLANRVASVPDDG